MKFWRLALCGGVLGGILATSGWAQSRTQILFADEGTPRDAILREINLAKTSIHLLMYSFTDGVIAQKLVDAKNRGVEVQVVLDNTQEKGKHSEGDFLVAQGVSVTISRGQNRNGIMHNKLAIFDGKTTLTGSYNWTDNARDNNHENLVILDDPGVATEAEKEFQRVAGKAQLLSANP
jgi:phosphatidylserine/phosphatidylglycerophosphate/cardiolipin synthase-like enzyme